tara:strand:+ start:2348 stop:2869 length:522 start_codon:yes stop_codon:yes gene_type:complete
MNQGDASSKLPFDNGRFRELSGDDLADITRLHKLWLETDKTQGRCADLSKTNLRGASLVGLNLKGANLEDAYLYGAYLKKADLQRANFSGANLRGANLRWADLRYSIFKGANLTKVDVMKSDLRGANLEETINLSCEQISSAIIDRETLLPSYLEVTWHGRDIFECRKEKLRG